MEDSKNPYQSAAGMPGVHGFGGWLQYRRWFYAASALMFAKCNVVFWVWLLFVVPQQKKFLFDRGMSMAADVEWILGAAEFAFRFSPLVLLSVAVLLAVGIRLESLYKLDSKPVYLQVFCSFIVLLVLLMLLATIRIIHWSLPALLQSF